jgi:hypothetical protein
MNIVTKIVLTRLIVGHTHEDIDSKFGVVWTYIRNKTLPTPQAYEKALKRCLKKNILAITLLKSLMCTPFQIIKVFSFLAPTPNSLDTVRKNRLSYNLFSIKCLLIKDFPLGVKTTYRAYAADNVVEIIEDPKCDIKLRVVSVKVTTFPTAKSNKSEVGGLFVLQNYPKCRLLPFAFPNPKSKETNLRQPIIRAAKAIHKVYNVVKAEISEQWAEFEKKLS